MNATAARPRAPDLLVWGIPAAALLHNLEEGLPFARFLPRVRAMIPQSAWAVLPDAGKAYLALVIVTVIPFGLALLARRQRSATWATCGLLLVAGVLLVNVGWHLVASAALGGYAPGVVTAVMINLPLTLAVLRWARREQWVSRRGLWTLLLIAVLLHAPGLMAAFALMGR